MRVYLELSVIEPRSLAFVLIHALLLFVLKTVMVTNAKINLKPPSFVKNIVIVSGNKLGK